MTDLALSLAHIGAFCLLLVAIGVWADWIASTETESRNRYDWRL